MKWPVELRNVASSRHKTLIASSHQPDGGAELQTAPFQNTMSPLSGVQTTSILDICNENHIFKRTVE
jgi:hypothetical protein